MNKQLENLSKDLASGVSRRKAMWKFAAGLTGIAGLGLLATKKASAAPAPPTPAECLEEAEFVYQGCLSGCLGECNEKPDSGATCNLECEEICIEDVELAYEVCISLP